MTRVALWIIVLLITACSGAPPGDTPSASTVSGTPSPVPTDGSTPAPTSSEALTPAPSSTLPGGGSLGQLIALLPQILVASCTPASADPPALVAASCDAAGLLGGAAGAAGTVEFVLYADDGEASDRWFAELARIGNQTGQDCAAGPSLVGYELDGLVEGRLLCAPDPDQPGGLIAVWFEGRNNVFGRLRLTGADYAALAAAVDAATLIGTGSPTPTAPVASQTPVVTPVGEPTPTPIAIPPSGSDLERLWAHIPPDFRQPCHQVQSFDGGFIVGVQCLPDAIEGYVTYYLFDTLENLNASFQSNVDFFGDGATGTSCQTEPSAGNYTIGGVRAGQLMCAQYDPGNPDGSMGLISFWTHEGYLIESTMVLYAEDYPAFWAAWQVAGPNPPDQVLPSPGTSPAAWNYGATEFRGRNGEQFTFTCAANGTPGGVYGTDTYTDDSSICSSAVHAGVITLATGGQVTIEIRPGLDSYQTSTRNGITSSSWGAWSGSFVFVSP